MSIRACDLQNTRVYHRHYVVHAASDSKITNYILVSKVTNSSCRGHRPKLENQECNGKKQMVPKYAIPA